MCLLLRAGISSYHININIHIKKENNFKQVGYNFFIACKEGFIEQSPLTFLLMARLSHKKLLHILVQAYNSSIKDYYYFPDVIHAGSQRIEKDDFLFLWSEGYLELYRHDTFGRFYRLSEKAEQLLYRKIIARSHKRKAQPLPALQGYLHFGECG